MKNLSQNLYGGFGGSNTCISDPNPMFHLDSDPAPEPYSDVYGTGTKFI